MVCGTDLIREGDFLSHSMVVYHVSIDDVGHVSCISCIAIIRKVQFSISINSHAFVFLHKAVECGDVVTL